jgi:nucleotide-binding universal stress UspA family protein
LVEKQAEAEKMMAGYREMLVDAGFAPDKVLVDIKVSRGPSVADSIIAELEMLKCCTVVVGRRGISKKEEFIFGSTSNKILHEAKNCAVMVIE